MNRSGLAAIVLAAAAAVLVPSAAQAADTRPCVSRTEFHGTFNGALGRVDRVTRHAVEERWDVVGLGYRRSAVLQDGEPVFVFTYRACGYDASEAQVFIVVWPTSSPRVRPIVGAILRVKSSVATLHGHDKEIGRIRLS